MNILDKQAFAWIEKQDLASHYDLLAALEEGIGHAELCRPSGVLLRIRGVWEFSCTDEETSLDFASYIKEHNQGRISVCMRGTLNAEKIIELLDVHTFRTECFLFTRFSKELFEINTDITINKLTEDYASFIAETYTLISDHKDKTGFALECIKSGMLGAFKDGKCIGYIGTHEEGTMGMLEILPQYRRKGYGRALEEALANEFLKKGIFPYCHVIISNQKSIALQQSMGFTSSKDNHLIWIG